MRLSTTRSDAVPPVTITGEKRLMCVSAHHKSGTVWIKRVLREVRKKRGIPLIGIWADRHLPRVPEEGRAFLVNWAGYFPKEIWARSDVGFLHLIRDPRDILLSGCAYHQKASEKGEKFLHQPRKDLNGKTYQEHLKSLPTQHDKLVFEMMHKHAQTVSEMRDWPWDDPRVAELRYEELMQDRSCRMARASFAKVGLADEDLDTAVEAFYDNSVFGGLSDPKARKGRLNKHITSNGMTNRWRQELPRSVGALYAKHFGDDLIALGYETDISWVDGLEAVPVQ